MMNNYDSTLNLPRTAFPMRAELVKREPKILARWINDDLYHIVRVAKKGKKIFILHDGPPYANGDIHIGHSANKILKDIITKFKNFAGFDSPYIPGWDCHGLPIELKVQEEYEKIGKKITSTEFRIQCREYAKNQVHSQREDFIRLGVLGDWSHSYLTMDFKTEANIIRTFSKIISNGHLTRATKPVHWCIDCCSALAESEIEYLTKITQSLSVAFEAIDQDTIKDKFGRPHIHGLISIVIWTTTPWTLPANCAISLSSKFEYSLVQIEGKALILAKDLVKDFMKYIKITNYTVLATIKGAEIEFQRFKHPFLDYDVPVVLSNHVTLNIGTGIVHIAGSHGPDDYNISMKYGLKITDPIGPNGVYLPGTYPELDGINVFRANKIIINLLRNKNTLLHAEKLHHSYPCCWRHKSPIIFRLTSQWFISMDQNRLREQSLEAIKNVQWIPDRDKYRIETMILNRPDWCISRQRMWGVPMSIFIHKKTYELHPRTLELMEEVAKRVEINGIQAWWDLNPYEIMSDDANLYEKVSDTLDVWFDSGSTHSSVIGAKSEFNDCTADMYLEGSDQHRGWFMSSLIISVAINGKAPYRQVLTHGFIVDGNKRKMSKSIGNVISPQELMNNIGADILRLWVASTDYKSEMTISQEILKHVMDNYRRIRNTIRFLLGNLSDFNPEKNIIEPEEMVVLDRWAVSCTKTTQDAILKAYESFNFHDVVQRLVGFCSINMCSFYLDVIKDRQYTTKANSIARRSCQTALYHTLEALVRWIAPIMSYTADETWNYLPGAREKYVFTVEWYEKLFGLDETKLMNTQFWSKLLEIRSEVNKIIEQERSNKKIRGSLEADIILYTDYDLMLKLTALGDELRFIMLTSKVKVMDYAQATPKAQQSELLKGLKIEVNKTKGKKCSRCWHYTIDVGKTAEYTDICERCINNIIGDGEKRKFV